eukprot:scaffold49445_cov30-Phaeocystis_antarctica.AAC.1
MSRRATATADNSTGGLGAISAAAPVVGSSSCNGEPSEGGALSQAVTAAPVVGSSSGPSEAVTAAATAGGGAAGASAVGPLDPGASPLLMGFVEPVAQP